MMTMCNAEIKSTLYPKNCPLFIALTYFMLLSLVLGHMSAIV